MADGGVLAGEVLRLVLQVLLRHFDPASIAVPRERRVCFHDSAAPW
jgi:hypothetical protein